MYAIRDSPGLKLLIHNPGIETIPGLLKTLIQSKQNSNKTTTEMSLNRQETAFLIDLLQLNEVLWNVQSKDYRNIHRKAAAYSSIASHFASRTVDDVNTK